MEQIPERKTVLIDLVLVTTNIILPAMRDGISYPQNGDGGNASKDEEGLKFRIAYRALKCPWGSLVVMKVELMKGSTPLKGHDPEQE